jgi:hypothetical protein
MRNFFVLFIFLVLQGCKPTNTLNIKHSKADQLVTRIELNLAKKLEAKYNIQTVGDSAQMPENVINNLGLMFQVNRILSKNEAREILVDCVLEFLAEVNSNEEIRPYLEYYPFTPVNISIALYISGPDGEDVYDPDLEVASARNGKLRYATKDKNQKFGYKSEYEETFEEALKLVKQAPSKVNH